MFKSATGFLKLIPLALALGWLVAVPASLQASAPCDPPNVIPRGVCEFDSFRGDPPRQIPNGWSEFILSGDPAFSQHGDTYWGAPSLMIRSNGGTFKVGIYTMVPVTPGAGYRASIAWGAPNAPDTFGRQLGLDPTGGTDPTSPDVVWGPMHWGPGRILNYPPPDVNIDVRARALGETMTVYFLVDHPRSTGDNLIFIDAIALYPDESAPAIEIPPTATPTPELVVVAAAPAPTATPLPPTSTPTATPTATPSATPTATATPSPSPTSTATATWTPLPTATPTSGGFGVNQTQAQILAITRHTNTTLLLILGMLSFGGAGVFGGTLLWLRRRGL